MAVGVQRHGSVMLGGQAGGNCRALFSMVATRCAPALPELAITTGGNLDYSSCVYSGKDLAGTADD